MNKLAWINQRLVTTGNSIPPELMELLRRNKHIQPPICFLDEVGGSNDTASMLRQFPTRHVIAFARRMDCDGVVCFVLSDPVFPPGHIVIAHDDGPAGYEVDDDFPSLQAWAKNAKEEIDERIRLGLNDNLPRRLLF